MDSQRDQKTSQGKAPKSEMKEGPTNAECRCKEMSKKTFSGLLRSMFRDFAFWKTRPKKL